MTATNGIRTEYKIKRLAAAVALAVAAMLGVSCLFPARADAAGTSDGNLVIDVPTTVPCALMADGTVVSPSEWKITTSGDAYIASASASGFPANVEWSARTTDLAAAQAGSVQVSGTGDAATVAGPSDPAAAKLAPSAGFEWSFSELDADKNSDIIAKAAGGTAVLGSVTFTFAKVEPDAFAVYSADDNSLSFYKRAGVPVAGQMFEGKTATEVYTGIETMTSIPGWTQNHFNDIKTVTVYDKGIAPTGTAFWFAGVRNLKTADVSKLDMLRCKTIECMFTDCISLERLDLSGWDTSSLTNMSQAFQHCASLTELNVSGWDVSKVTNMQLAFAEDKALRSLDLSTWDNSATTSMKDAFLQMDSLNEISLGSKFKFVGTNGYLPTPSSAYIAGADGKWYDTDSNGYAPADIPSNKAMTYTAIAPKKAFAVYSADDNSLNFYKRAGVPVAGQMFEGKTATEVYTGIETKTSIPGWMLNYSSSIKTVTVYDEGIAPIGTGHWFAELRNMKTADVSKLDMSKCKTISCMFTDCTSLETLDLSAWDTRSLTSMSQAFQNCTSLTKLNVSGWDVSKVTDMDLAFAEDRALSSLDLSTWDNSAATTMKDVFSMMDSLSEVSLGSKFKFVGTNGYLPTPNSAYIAGADGKWYDTDGNGYAPKDIPSSKAMTYTAVPPSRPKTAFAVYSADDNSLSFYKRAGVPSAGEQFEGKTATEVYEGVEDASYTAPAGAPWSGHAADIASVTVADAGVSPVSTAYWFKGASKLKSVSLAGLDTSQTTCMDGMFQGCSSLETLDLSAMSTRRVASMTAFLGGCDSLAELSIGSEFAWVGEDCYPPTGDWKQGSTGTKYAENQIPANKTDKYTRTKTAFAVYSVDDNSLTFYKRFEAPTEGAQFLGKTVTGVYTGFETETYGHGSDVPWSDYVNNIKTATIADDGVAPFSTAYWFYSFRNVDSIDLAKLDTSGTTNMSHMFESCKSSSPLPLKWLDTSKATNLSYMFSAARGFDSAALSALDTSSAEDLSHMFEYCTTIQSLSLKGFDTSKATDISSMFENCWSLESVDVSSFDTRNVSNMHGLFYKCKALKTIDITSFDASNVEDASCMFVDCGNLSSLDMSHFNISKCGQLYRMFDGCSSLKELDLRSFNNLNLEGGEYDTMDNMFDGCSSLEKVSFSENFVWIWIMDSSLPHPNASNIPGADGNWYAESDGIGYAPTAIPSKKADTYYASKDLLPKAFAVFSADDGSLNFYKRAGVPSAGDQFEGKTATAVYTGIEEKPTSSQSPWRNNASKIKTATVVDNGIKPVSTAGWFASAYYNLVAADFTKLDTSNVTDISKMFLGCGLLTTVGDISNWNTSNVTNMAMLFYFDSKLSVDCSNWNVSKVTNHFEFNTKATGVTVPLAWQDSSDEGVEDSAVAPLSEEQGNRNALSVPNESDNDAGNSTKPSADSADATQNAAEGKPPHEAKTSKESGMTTEPDGVEKDAEAKPAVENKATKEDVTTTEPEGVEKATVKKSGE